MRFPRGWPAAAAQRGWQRRTETRSRSRGASWFSPWGAIPMFGRFRLNDCCTAGLRYERAAAKAGTNACYDEAANGLKSRAVNGARREFPRAHPFENSSRGTMTAGAEHKSAGARFRAAVREERPLQVAGAINAYAARMAEAVGFRALYLSGGGVAANSLGLPDLGISSMEDVLIDVRRITDATTLPLLVDIDTGWGGAFNIARTIRAITKAGAGAVHIEDQVGQKRCGHRPGKELVPAAEMVDRIKAAVDARTDAEFVIMARTDALASEGLSPAVDRARAYVAAGADMIFAEAVTELAMYTRFKETVGVPILANITEFGKTPLYTAQELAAAGVDIVLYCCAAYRAMNAAALKVYEAIRTGGTQKHVVPMMQTRADLYKYLDYHAYEEKLDDLF